MSRKWQTKKEMFQFSSKSFHSLTFHHANNATRAPIANPPNSAQLGAASTPPPSHIRVRAVVWAYGRGHTHIQTHTHRHNRRAWPQYILRRLRLRRNAINVNSACHTHARWISNGKALFIMRTRTVHYSWVVRLGLRTTSIAKKFLLIGP